MAYITLLCVQAILSASFCASPISHFHLLVNPRRACAGRVTVVGSVCLSVKSHLTYGASVRPENAVTYSAGNEGPKFVGFSLKPLRCRDPALPPLYG